MSDAVDVVPAGRPIAAVQPPAPSLLRLIREDVGPAESRGVREPVQQPVAVTARCRGDPAARSELETLLTYPGIHALIWHRLAHRLWAADWRFLARLFSWFGRFLTNVDIHPGATIGRRLFITRKTVAVHVSNILTKMGVSGRVEAAAAAIRLGMTDRE